MPQAYRLSVPGAKLEGSIALEPSKSLSNRALLIRSLCDQPFEIHQLSTSDDTRVLVNMLTSAEETLYAGYAGSSYRFMLARACLFDRPVILDASKQLRSRPIGPLVRALRLLGAKIDYLDRDGFPPVRITPSDDFGKTTHSVSLHAGVSSQYTSALLMIAPLLPNGLVIKLEDDPVSLSYIRMTLSMMKYFGVANAWRGDTITISKGAYTPKPITIEGDWSAASYYYSMVALAPKASLHITGLGQHSLQGDSIVEKLYAQLGVQSTWEADGLHLTKQESFTRPELFAHDFSMCPDIAQTVMVTLAGLGIEGKLSGLKTLQFKESDRLTVMAAELSRVKTELDIREKKGQVTAHVKGKAKWKDKAKFETYDDHRVAMSLAPLGAMHPILIKDPQVVSKSYPGFWEALDRIGFKREVVKV